MSVLDREPQLFPQASRWTARLTELAGQPLERCGQFPEIARRFEAWWEQELLDRPLLIGIGNTDPKRPITRRLDLIDQPDLWLQTKLQDLSQQVFFGDAIPHVRVDFGPTLTIGLIGGSRRFESDTAWSEPIINDAWSNCPDWRIQVEGKWWRRMEALFDRAVEAARGRFVVCAPNLGGSADILTNLRGATELCMDVLDQPDAVIRASESLHAVWRQAFTALYRLTVERGVGLVHWHLLWSNSPYVITECDLGFSIGPQPFRRVCLPDIARQAAAAGRSVFHLDGAGSTRHLDALLEIPEIKAIQYTPGAGTPSALPWIGMFRRIQERGRSVLIFAPVHEVVELAAALRPEGLAIFVEGPATVQEIEAAFTDVCRRFGRGQGVSPGKQ